jgi:hypothetical protein
MVTVLGGLTEFERHQILTRTIEGRIRAKASGEVRSQACATARKALRRLASGEMLTEIAKSFNVSHIMIARTPMPRELRFRTSCCKLDSGSSSNNCGAPHAEAATNLGSMSWTRPTKVSEP